MKTGLVSISFRKLSPADVISLTCRSGLGSIEWGGDIHVPPQDLANAQKVGQRTRDAGLEVACYGSYYRLLEADEAPQIAAAAKALGAPLIRVWAGNQGSADCPPEQREIIRQNAQNLARIAAQEGIDVAFEYHGKTLTDTADSALALLEAVNLPNVGTLWQPPVNLPIADCVASIRKVSRYIRNIHVFSWNGTERLPLQEGAEKWRACLSEIEKLPGEHRLMMEFVRGDEPQQLVEDAACLARWLEGSWE